MAGGYAGDGNTTMLSLSHYSEGNVIVMIVRIPLTGLKDVLPDAGIPHE